MDQPPGKIFFLGFGYCARALGHLLAAEGWAVSGTCQNETALKELENEGFDATIAEGTVPPAALAGVTHMLNSAPPTEAGDPFLSIFAGHPGAVDRISWFGYLSSLGVYGDTGGRMVDEGAEPQPSMGRTRRRLEAEQAWLALWKRQNLAVHLFRLAGIYGPGRSALDRVKAGRAQRIEKPGHAFSRIHVDDVGAVLRASMARPNPGAIYNLCDDEAASQAQVVEFACRLLGTAAAPMIPFVEAEKDFSPMARGFWQDNRRVDNARIKKELGVRLKYPTYREGLRAILAADG